MGMRGKKLVAHLEKHVTSYHQQKRPATDKDLIAVKNKLDETISRVQKMESLPNKSARDLASAQERGERCTDCVDTFLPSNDSLACAYANVAVCMFTRRLSYPA